MNSNNIAPKKNVERDALIYELLVPAFLDNYIACKKKQVSMDEYKYKLFSAPGPSQYLAFCRFFAFFKGGENVVNNKDNYLYLYNITLKDTPESAMVEFVQNLASDSYDAKGKKIKFSFGSFWAHDQATRKNIISLMNELEKKGADVSLFTQSSETEEGMDNISPTIKNKSRFNLKKRISIHYVRVDEDFVFLEFPHTEATDIRLGWFLDLNNIKFKFGKNKKGLLQYLDSLIERACN